MRKKNKYYDTLNITICWKTNSYTVPLMSKMVFHLQVLFTIISCVISLCWSRHEPQWIDEEIFATTFHVFSQENFISAILSFAKTQKREGTVKTRRTGESSESTDRCMQN